MKLSDYAKQQGVRYETAWRWFQEGKIKGHRVGAHTIMIDEGIESVPVPVRKVAVYARVFSAENKPNLDSQAERLVAYCMAKGYQISKVVKEVGSGANDVRPKFLALLEDSSISIIVVEHRERATCFGARYIETLLRIQGRSLEVVNVAEHAPEDLLADVTSMIYAFCAKLYGPRRVAFASKNLYNAALYEMRQSFIHQGRRIYFRDLYHLMKSHEAYKALPAKVAQQVLKLLDKNWESYVEAVKAWNEDPSKFLGHPKLPKYKDKQKGRNILVFTVQAVSKKGLKRGMVQPSGVPIEMQTAHTAVNQVRIVPRGGYYVVEVVYEQEAKPADVDVKRVASLDVGINNLVALTSNTGGFAPRLVNGRPIKSVNQFRSE